MLWLRGDQTSAVAMDTMDLCVSTGRAGPGQDQVGFQRESAAEGIEV